MEPGTILIFGIVLAPLYAVIIGWFRGRPNDTGLSIMGLVYLFGITTALWGGLLIFSLLIGLLFF